MSEARGLGIGDMLYNKVTGEHLPKSTSNEPIFTTPSVPLEMENEILKHSIDSEFLQLKHSSQIVPKESKTLRDRIEQFGSLINEASEKYSLDPNLVKAVIASESRGNVEAHSSKDAKGIMQLIDSTAEEMGVKNIWDPKENILGGTRYLRKMLDRFDGNVQKALASYNAGPGAVEKFDGIPPYKETQAYVQRTMKLIDYFKDSE